MADEDRIVALAFLTERELLVARQALKRIYPVPADRPFDDLLKEIERLSGPPVK